MKKRILPHTAVAWLMCLLVLGGTSTSYAQPAANDKEIEVSGGLFHAEGSDSGALNVDLSFGYYYTPGWQVGLRQAVNYTFVDDGPDAWVATTAPFLNYHFRFGNIVPFLGAFIGLAWNDRDATGLLGPQGGVKFFLNEQTYLGLRYRYEWFFNSLRRVGRNADDGNHVFNLGVGFVWGGARTAKPTR
jgi:hypothetical protein